MCQNTFQAVYSTKHVNPSILRGKMVVENDSVWCEKLAKLFNEIQPLSQLVRMTFHYGSF